MSRSLQAQVLIPGRAEGIAMKLDDTLSFWGGFDPANGSIIDVHHPQYGERVGQRILFIPESRGSAGTPGGVAETLRNGSGPLAFVLGERDVNIGVGTLVANRLYDLEIPVLAIRPGQFDLFEGGERVSIDADGLISVLDPA